MIYSIQSNDPKKYGTIDVNINIPWKCEHVKYFISSINTYSNFLITTDEDYLELTVDTTVVKIPFENRSEYEVEDFPSLMSASLMTYVNLN